MSTFTPMTSQQILIKYWGYSSFRPLQEDIIDSVLAGKDTLALMPTGGGKSICFQVPALKLEGICIVVTPLIALMKDQVQQLDKRGIRAVAIFSGMHPREIDIALDNCAYGDVKFLYVSPERLETELFQERLKKMNVSLLAVDEAHCISQWGYDFRPSYLRIADIKEIIPSVPILALTATATPTVVIDIQKRLLFPQENLYQMSFERTNLSYMVEFREDKNKRLLQLIEANSGTAVIYVRNRRKTKEIAQYLMENGISCHFYHAGLTPEERDRKQNDWINNRVRIMISTNAFGMGIDKSDVRLVVHMDVPDSLEAYFQEAGRAGRDGKPALAMLLYHKGDLIDLNRNFESRFPEISYIKNVYNALGNYFQLAIGSGRDDSNEFVLADFIQMYDLNALLAYNSIKFLEKEGYLFLSEAMSRPSKLMIIVNRETLYRHQVRNPKIGDFIDVLIRSYSGLFTDFSIIDEFALAKRLKTSTLVIENTLKFLHKSQLITYVPQSTKPQIIFTEGRLNIKDVIIHSDNYALLKKAAFERLEAIIQYVSLTTKCRSEILLSYFGQEETQRCGQCDVCLLRNKISLSEHEFNGVIEIIKPLLLQKNMTISELLQKTPTVDENRLIKVIRWLTDNGKITEFGGQLIWVT